MADITIVPFLNKLDKFIINPLILLAFTLAFMYFIYGIVKFLSVDVSDKGNARKEARDSIMWGLVGMLIMFSVYGIIKFVLATFGISTDDPSLINAKPYIKI